MFTDQCNTKRSWRHGEALLFAIEGSKRCALRMRVGMNHENHEFDESQARDSGRSTGISIAPSPSAQL
ncbi:MAG: hypothetical protein M3Y67_07030, partial [Pseudomonadota bacterium]|nr:hypothetical protein [Pseudomonadota bacterium]